MEYEQHPLGQIMPAMSKDEFDELCKSVAAVGPKDDIYIYQCMVLDGWHLYKACLKAGQVPRFIEFCDGDPLAFVEARHTRRNLTPYQKGVMALRLKEEYAKRGKPRAAAAHDVMMRMHVSKGTLANAAIIQQNGSSAVKKAALNGTHSLKDLAEQSRKPKAQQKVPATKKKPKPATIPEMRDASGHPVPNHLRDIFADHSLDEMVAALGRMIPRVKELAAHNLHVRLGEAVDALTHAISALDQQPHVVHQQCGGAGCKMCKQSGFLTRHASFSESQGRKS